MKSQKGVSLISILLVIIIISLCIFMFKFIFNNNSENTNINTENKEESEIVGLWDNDGFIYTFNEDGTANLSGRGIHKQEYTYKIESNKISLTNIETNATMTIEYSIKDDKLYIGSQTYTKVKQ